MTLRADGRHLVPLLLELFFGQTRDLAGLYEIESGGGLALLIEYAERLEDRYAVIHPVLVVLRQTERQEAPGGHHIVVAVAHVAGLARGRPLAVLALDLPDRAVL